ncbi:hypothetical protein K502DRAFT_367947 [Neoconidiobolus thromboides FSU 785]|nr:hypothetical protein K502DRAFT_367947 [Neoconidiobolus thromboides FSU 785]
MMRRNQEPRSILYKLSSIDPRNAIEDILSKSYNELRDYIAQFEPDQMSVGLRAHASTSKDHYHGAIQGLFYFILAMNEPPDFIFQLLLEVNQDEFQELVRCMFLVIEQPFLNLMREEVLEKLFWIINRFPETELIPFAGVVRYLITEIPIGPGHIKKINYYQHLVNLSLKILDRMMRDSDFEAKVGEETSNIPDLMGQSCFTFLKKLQFHNAFPDLQLNETRFCSNLLDHKPAYCLSIGRDLLRTISQISRIATITHAWSGMMARFATIDQPHKGTIRLFMQPTPKEYISGYLNLQLKERIHFILNQININEYPLYHTWLKRDYFDTPEGQFIVPDIVRYICYCVKVNENGSRRGMQRHQLIKELLNIIESEIIAAEAKFVLFYDWFFFDETYEDIMILEPTIQLIFNPTNETLYLSQMLIEYLDNLLTNYIPELETVMRIGVSKTMESILKSGLLHSIEPLYNHPDLDPGIKYRLYNLFKDHLQVSEPERPNVFPFKRAIRYFLPHETQPPYEQYHSPQAYTFPHNIHYHQSMVTQNTHYHESMAVEKEVEVSITKSNIADVNIYDVNFSPPQDNEDSKSKKRLYKETSFNDQEGNFVKSSLVFAQSPVYNPPEPKFESLKGNEVEDKYSVPSPGYKNEIEQELNGQGPNTQQNNEKGISYVKEKEKEKGTQQNNNEDILLITKDSEIEIEDLDASDIWSFKEDILELRRSINESLKEEATIAFKDIIESSINLNHLTQTLSAPLSKSLNLINYSNYKINDNYLPLEYTKSMAYKTQYSSLIMKYKTSLNLMNKINQLDLPFIPLLEMIYNEFQTNNEFNFGNINLLFQKNTKQIQSIIILFIKLILNCPIINCIWLLFILKNYLINKQEKQLNSNNDEIKSILGYIQIIEILQLYGKCEPKKIIQYDFIQLFQLNSNLAINLLPLILKATSNWSFNNLELIIFILKNYNEENINELVCSLTYCNLSLVDKNGLNELIDQIIDYEMNVQFKFLKLFKKELSYNSELVIKLISYYFSLNKIILGKSKEENRKKTELIFDILNQCKPDFQLIESLYNLSYNIVVIYNYEIIIIELLLKYSSLYPTLFESNLKLHIKKLIQQSKKLSKSILTSGINIFNNELKPVIFLSTLDSSSKIHLLTLQWIDILKHFFQLKKSSKEKENNNEFQLLEDLEFQRDLENLSKLHGL